MFAEFQSVASNVRVGKQLRIVHYFCERGSYFSSGGGREWRQEHQSTSSNIVWLALDSLFRNQLVLKADHIK